MRGFQSSRALVIDDVDKEAVPVLRALGRLGIASIYHNPSSGWKPETPKLGIRLLVLDMILAEIGAPADDPAAAVDVLLSQLELFLDPVCSEPVVMIAWTSHPDHVKALMEKFVVVFPALGHVQVAILDKSLFLNSSESDQEDSIARALCESLAELHPTAALVNWERIVHDAAVATTREIGTVISAWREKLKDGQGGKKISDGSTVAINVFAALARAEGGERLANEDPKESLASFIAALSPLLIDQLQGSMEWLLQEGRMCQELHEVVRAQSGDKKLLAEIAPYTKRLQSIYLFTDQGKDVIRPGSLSTVKRDVGKIFFEAAIDKDTLTEAGDVSGRLVLLSLTPVCDYAQAKHRQGVFVAGLLLPTSKRRAVQNEKAAFLRIFEPLYHELTTEGVPVECLLILNAHFLVTMSFEAAAANLQPVKRLREAPMSDVFSWIGGQMTRPGYLRL